MGIETERRYALTADSVAYAMANAAQSVNIEQIYSSANALELKVQNSKVTSVIIGGQQIPISPDKQEEFFELTKRPEYNAPNLLLKNGVIARIRRASDAKTGKSNFFFTIKAKGSGATRPEFETEWDGSNFDAIKAQPGTSLLKTRLILPHSEYKIEVDIFKSNGYSVSLEKQPIIAEIESDEAILLPTWMQGAIDVTGNSPSNYELAAIKTY